MNFFIINVLSPFSWNRYEHMSSEGVFIILVALGFLLLLSKVMRKKPIQFPKVESLELEQYTFGFEETNNKIKSAI